MPMFCIFAVLFSLPSLFALDPFTKLTQLNLPSGLIGPESVALDRFRQGPYVGISDGRILKYKGQDVRFVDFAFTSPNRTKQLCDGATDPNLGPTCGRILGFSFNTFTGELFIVDTFRGLFEVGPLGGRATLVATGAGGVPFNFLNAIDADPITGDVYVTDGSLTFNFRNLTDPNLVRDSSGRLIKYNPLTKKTTVLLKGLSSPAGVAVSADGSFLLFTEQSTKKIRKYTLRGPKATTVETLVTVPGNPLKIKRASTLGDFWVPVNLIVQQPRSVTPFGYKINSSGQILIIKNLSDQYNNVQIQVVQEYNNATLYVGSRSKTFVGIYSKN